MAKQLITIGTPGAGGGDPAHAAFKKINDNATELYNAAIPDTEAKKTQARANLGLGAAATKNVGTNVGNVIEVGAFGVGSTSGPTTFYSNINIGNIPTGYYSVSPTATGSPGANGGGNLFVFGSENYQVQFHKQNIQNRLSIRFGTGGDLFTGWGSILISGINTTTDGNGFIKAASPTVQLYADNIQLNEEAQLQDITFEKPGIGDYLIKGSLGFAQIGWYIEMPKDANGNVLVAVVYEQLENNDISVKTYAKKFDDETGDIVANLTKPRDIPAGRWIDLRLQELPQPEVILPESIAPPDFQPTNLAQAVAEALNNDIKQ